jgi:hypothetical protein
VLRGIAGRPPVLPGMGEQEVRGKGPGRQADAQQQRGEVGERRFAPAAQDRVPDAKS